MASKKMDVIFSSSKGENEKRRRATFERPDIAHVREVISRRFEVDVREMSIQARVTVRGSQREYVVSSSEDLEELWEEIEELYVVPKAKPTGLAVVFNENEETTRRITFNSQDFKEIVEQVCDQFQAEKCSLAGKIKGDETKYAITSNEDVEELWSDIEKLYVTGKKKRLNVDTTVMHDQCTYYIDREPDPDSTLVQKFRSDVYVEAMIEADACFRMMGDLTNIMYYAAVATGKVDMQVKTKDIGFKVIEICHSADNTVNSYVLACSEVNEMFRKAVQYLFEDDHRRALRVIATLAGTAQRCKERTEALISQIDETMQAHLLLTDDKLSGGKPLDTELIYEERNAATDQYEKAERELLVATQQWKDLQRNPRPSQQNPVKQSSAWSSGGSPGWSSGVSSGGSSGWSSGRSSGGSSGWSSGRSSGGSSGWSSGRSSGGSSGWSSDGSSGGNMAATVGTAATLGTAATIGTIAAGAVAATLAAPVFLLGAAVTGIGTFIASKFGGKKQREAAEERQREAEERQRQAEQERQRAEDRQRAEEERQRAIEERQRQAKEERQRQAEEERREREEAERKKGLKERLNNALGKVAEAQSNKECFSALAGELVIMRSSLLKIKAFFNQLLGFCGTIQASEDGVIKEMAEDQLEVDCKELLESPGTKLEMVYYQAKWVAIKQVCLGCQQTLIDTNKELHKRIEENPTRQQAKDAIGGMVKNAKRTYNL